MRWDGICRCVLKDCADQLVGFFTKNFNHSLSQFTVPSCLKSSTIVTLPQKKNSTTLNDYLPVALTPVVKKCFEKLVRSHITSFHPPTFDSHQFAYRVLRAESPATYPLHPWLHPHSPQQQLPQICRWHHSSGGHLEGGWVQLQRRDGAVGGVV